MRPPIKEIKFELSLKWPQREYRMRNPCTDLPCYIFPCPLSQCIDLGDNSVYEEAWPLGVTFYHNPALYPFHRTFPENMYVPLWEKEVHRAYLPMTQSYQNVFIFAVHDEIDIDNAKALQDNCITKKKKKQRLSSLENGTNSLGVCFSPGVGRGWNLRRRPRWPAAHTFCWVKRCMERICSNVYRTIKRDSPRCRN